MKITKELVEAIGFKKKDKFFNSSSPYTLEIRVGNITKDIYLKCHDEKWKQGYSFDSCNRELYTLHDLVDAISRFSCSLGDKNRCIAIREALNIDEGQ